MKLTKKTSLSVVIFFYQRRTLFCITKKSFLLSVVISLGITSCVSTQRTDLFFGRNIPGGGYVSDSEWKNFTDSVVSPLFPQGYTEWDASGKWLDTETRKTISENTKVVTFIGKKSKSRNIALDSVIRIYIHKYKQQAVLRLDSRSQVKFISVK